MAVGGGFGTADTALARAGLLLVIAALGLAGCATAPARLEVQGPRRPAPGGELHGTDKPYQVEGVWYYPHAEPDYDVVGYASWYGQAFHNRRTADGEVFDQDGLTAAHRTLPLPSLVEVTNLDNGRKVRLRLNDRGPFAGDRVLDVSRGAAEQLGFARQGLARVRVRYVGPAPAFPPTMTYASLDGPSSPGRRPGAAPVVRDVDGPSSTTSSRPAGWIQAATLPAPTPIAPGAPPQPIDQPPVQPLPTDSSRFTEPTVALPPQPITAAAPDAIGDTAPPAGSQAPRPMPVGVTSLDEPPPPTPASAPPLGPAVSPTPVARPHKPARAGGYSVQAGAFASRQNADRAAARLGPDAAIRPLLRDGLTLYRVVLSGFEDAASAEAGRVRAVAAGFPGARIVGAE